VKAQTRRHASRIVALAIVVVVTLLVVEWPTYSGGQLDQMAAKYSFDKRELVSASTRTPENSYDVEGPLKHFQAWASVIGAAVALADADRDGRANDYCLVDPRYTSATLGPAPGTGNRFQAFQLDPRPLRYDDTMAPTGCTHGDFNEDGRIDFLVSYAGRTPVLFLRRPGTPLAPAGFERQELVGGRDKWISDTVAQADVDGDGHVDLLVGNYFRDGISYLDPSVEDDPRLQFPDTFGRANNGGGVRVFLWDSARRGDRPAATYREAKNVIPKEYRYGWTVAVGATDLNDDMRPEIFVANDFGHDHLFVNESTPGNVRLHRLTGRRDAPEGPLSDILGKDSYKGMSSAIGDFTGDGRFDIFVSNITSEYGMQESNLVWENTGGPLRAGDPAPFKENSEDLGLARSGWGWDTKIGDFDADGTPELVQAMGLIKGKTNRWAELHEYGMANDRMIQYPALFPNARPGDDVSGHELDAFWAFGPEGRFANISDRIDGLDKPMVSRGVALADVDRDGRLDFALGNQWEDSFLFRNTAPRRSFLGLDLLVPAAGERTATRVLDGSPRGMRTRSAIGAVATVHLPSGKKLVQPVDGGNGHAGFSARELFFGLGDQRPRRVRVDIAWRDAEGLANRTSVTLRPGWHTVLLEQR
jgi:enediyne biosynthesis protein E4